MTSSDDPKPARVLKHVFMTGWDAGHAAGMWSDDKAEDAWQRSLALLPATALERLALNERPDLSTVVETRAFTDPTVKSEEAVGFTQERLAGERGGEAVALDEVAFRGGFAKGSYECLCMACGEAFEGDKRAVHCRPCAIAKALPDPPAAAPQPLPVEVEREGIVWPDDVLDRVEEWVNRKGGDADVRDIAAALIAAAHPALGGSGR